MFRIIRSKACSHLAFLSSSTSPRDPNIAQFTTSYRFLLRRNLEFIARALREILKTPQPLLTAVSCSEVFESQALLPPESPAEWNIPFYNIALCGVTELAPHALLDQLKKIEYRVGRQERARWAPREIDIDILAYGILALDDAVLRVPHPGLAERPFALWPMTALVPEFRFPEGTPQQGKSALELSKRWGFVRSQIPCRTWRAPYVVQRDHGALIATLKIPLVPGPLNRTELVGVVNATPDSFSDGANFFDSNLAVKHASELCDEGCSVLDFGAESTRPGAAVVNPDEEWARLEAVLEGVQRALQAATFKPLVSVDTRHAAVACRALKYNIDWLNDVSGFSDPDMVELAADTDVDLVVMHSVTIPPSRQHNLDSGRSAVTQLLEWAEQKIDTLGSRGINKDRLIIDPGIGFGKSAEQSLEIVTSVNRFMDLGVRILIGHSRKSFLSLFTDRPFAERDSETALISAFLARQGVHYLRVHNVRKNQAVLN